MDEKKKNNNTVNTTKLLYYFTILQAGRSRVRFPTVSLEIFIYTIFPAALWLWGWLSPNRNEYQEIFPGK